MHDRHTMASLQVRDIPEHIHLKLLELARKENRSLAQQTITILAAGLNLVVDPKTRRKEAIREARELMSRIKIGDFPDNAKLVREDRDR